MEGQNNALNKICSKQKMCKTHMDTKNTTTEARGRERKDRGKMAGMDVVTLSRLLGHTTPSVTLDKYGHALNDHKRASVEKLGGVYSAGRGIPRSRDW